MKLHLKVGIQHRQQLYVTIDKLTFCDCEQNPGKHYNNTLVMATGMSAAFA
jgi:hypothetical protein